MHAQPNSAVVSKKGARRWEMGHPWIYKSDVIERPSSLPGVVLVHDQRHKPLGWALWSPHSEISLRLLERDHRTSPSIDAAWWRDRLRQAIARRAPLADVTTAYRLVHGEADGCPSLICDRYDQWLVVQLMSAGLEQFRGDIVNALLELVSPRGILARNDVPLRAKERLPQTTELLAGEVPQEIEVVEHGVRFLAAPWGGQKTGAFLDQRENYAAAARYAHGEALDVFCYQGGFAFHLAQSCSKVTGVDSSRPALEVADRNAALNRREIEWVEANAFDLLRDYADAGRRYDTIVLDPPAFARSKSNLETALRGYKELNLRALKMLRPGGILVTCCCSYHVSPAQYLDVLRVSARDVHRNLRLMESRTQAKDHPILLNIPETEYLKCFISYVTN